MATITLIAAILLGSGCTTISPSPSQTYNAELEYLKSLHQTGPVTDPQLVAFLMQQFMNANQLHAGTAFFESFLQQHGGHLAPEQTAVYLSAVGVLRASSANQVPLLSRIAWVNKTIEILEHARDLTKNEDFLVRWMIGVVYAQLPEWFNKVDTAMTDLKWCVDNIAKAPHDGWLREPYYQLAVLYDRVNNQEQAKAYLHLSGHDGFNKPLILTTPYAVNATKGFTFHPKRLREIVPGKIFNLSGFEFTEYYFIVSQDGKELISIDAGTRPDAAQAAYEFLRQSVPDLPPLTTVFVTHSHWDHIGGHGYFHDVAPQVKFYARDNYRQELEIVRPGTRGFRYFFGDEFKDDFVSDFKPDITVRTRTEVTIGGTRFALIPAPGGETVDGLFIHVPEHDTLFVGDFIMPYLGAPFHQHPEVHFPFLVMRENVINRIYDQNVGYWQPDLQGMDHLSQEEFGVLLTHYLERSEPQLVTAIKNMLESGDHALAARTTTWALTQYPSSAKLRELKKMAFLKQKEKYQELSPFKVIVYSEAIQHGTPQLQHPLPNKGIQADAP